MNTAIVITALVVGAIVLIAVGVIVSLLILTLIWIGGFLYSKGTTRSSVTPAVIQNIITPTLRPEREDAPPLPTVLCPRCAQAPPEWKLDDDEQTYLCQHKDCGGRINGPKAPIRS